MREKHRGGDFDRLGTTQSKACLLGEDTFEILLSQFCQGWFHPGNGETDGLSRSYGLHVGGERVLVGTVCNSNRSPIVL